MTMIDDDERLRAWFAAAARDIPVEDSSAARIFAAAADPDRSAPVVPVRRRNGRQMRLVLAAAAGLIVIVTVVVGRGSGKDDLVAVSYDDYFDTFSFDFDPAADRAELADRSEMVVEATLVDVVDGPVFGSSATDPAGSRFALFVFESDSTSEPIVVRLPRPNTSDVAALREVMPLGDRAVLYLRRIPEIPAAEQDLWFGIDDDIQLWMPTTPQGFILETHAEDGSAAADVPIGGGDEIGDPPAPGSDISAWLPAQGEIIPSDA